MSLYIGPDDPEVLLSVLTAGIKDRAVAERLKASMRESARSKGSTMRDRYYWRTIGYHVWGIFRRDDHNMNEARKPDSALDRLVESVGATRRGDAAARDACRARVERLNAE